MLPPRSNHGADFRVLLVEDNPYDADLTKALLRVYLTCQVTTVTTRVNFETALEQSIPDLIISDSNLKSFDGFTALQLATQKRPGVPFVFYSGQVTEKKKREALARGAADYISKEDTLGLIEMVYRFCREGDRQ